MSTPKLLFYVHPHNDTHLLLEILGSDGSWQIPIAKEQAAILAEQMNFLAKDKSEKGRKKDLVAQFFKESMVRLPAGRLWMGSMPGEEVPEDELPRHSVYISRPFYLSTMLVPQGLYHEVMDENPSVEKGAKKPACGLTWFEAIAFCNALSEREGLELAYSIGTNGVRWNASANGYRLPTEAEWEYAARTQEDLHFVGSDQFEEVAHCEENSEGLADIAMKKPNDWGFFDMSGLVFEWCWDVYAPYQNDGSYDEKIERVCRGGSCKHSSKFARTTARYSALPSHKGMIGIRVARNAVK